MRWLITGSQGQLGSEFGELLAAGERTGDEVLLRTDVAELDITDSRAVDALVADFRPDVLLNAAAYTAVDDAESHEELAHRINAVGPANLAAALSRHGGRLIHISTDYVFDGSATAPYEVTDAPAPRSAYGRTKLAGEQAVLELLPSAAFVVRTAWVYSAVGANFVKTMIRLESERDVVSVVDDQRGSPTWAADLARGLMALARSAAPAGTYHCTGTGDTTWFGFTRAIFEELGADPSRVHPTTTEAFPRPAPRPARSVLSDAAWLAAGLPPMPGWREALTRAMPGIRAAMGA